MGIAVAIITPIAVLVIVFGGVAALMRGYDHHPIVRRVLDAFARTVPGYYRPTSRRDQLPKSYTDKIPGWDDNP